jgi:hemolysin III
MKILKNERISAYTHGARVPVMAACAGVLVILSWSHVRLQISLVIYGVSAIALFTASFLYHAMKRAGDEKSLWRKLDRSAIFILIAGTGSPMCFLYLQGRMMWWIFAAQWALVTLGLVIIFFLNVPRKVSTVIYIAMGALCILPFMTCLEIIPPAILILFLAGGLLYTAGGIVYALKKPDLGLGFHEIFHIFVIAGALSHMAMIISGVALHICS